MTELGLERANILDIRDLSVVTPGLKITGDNQLGQSPVTIRGIGSAGGGIGSDDSVGVYIDGVYLGRPAGNSFNIVDIEHIEVIRGPQGTLYGRNATGGAISFVTKRPSTSEEVFGQIQGGRFQSVFGRGYVITPINDEFGVVAAVTAVRDRSLYCATKAAVAQMTKALARELAPYDVNVNSIGPGNTATPMNADVRLDRRYEQQRQGREAATPSAVFGSAGDRSSCFVSCI